MRLILPLFLAFAACAHAPLEVSRDEQVLISMVNTLPGDICAIHLWSDEESYKSVENRLLPGSSLLEPTSAFRLHAGDRRDFRVPAQAPLRMEAVDCNGRLVESRELPARPGSVVSLALTVASR